MAQVATWVHNMFCNFYLVKNHKIAKNPTATKAREKTSTYLKSLELFGVCSTKFRINQILLNKLATDLY